MDSKQREIMCNFHLIKKMAQKPVLTRKDVLALYLELDFNFIGFRCGEVIEFMEKNMNRIYVVLDHTDIENTVKSDIVLGGRTNDAIIWQRFFKHYDKESRMLTYYVGFHVKDLLKLFMSSSAKKEECLRFSLIDYLSVVRYFNQFLRYDLEKNNIKYNIDRIPIRQTRNIWRKDLVEREAISTISYYLMRKSGLSLTSTGIKDYILKDKNYDTEQWNTSEQ